MYRTSMKTLTRAPFRAMKHWFPSLSVLMVVSGFISEGCHMCDETTVLDAVGVMWLAHYECL